MAKKTEKTEKTNVMRLLDAAKIDYIPHEYDPSVTDGVTIAKILGENEEKVFKTLVTEAPGGLHFVFVIPVAETLDLKAAARAAGVKSISMIKQKELLPLTGYIHGGCSPVGMKKPFPTFFDVSAEGREAFCVSAGKVGCQIETSPLALAAFVGAKFAGLTVK
ncbi:MAG: Cys-tRNA(Pro) deacylase [Clostridia bacterium]|nr:Cys-tRNA(Pro) deacylase [Clostridia bacterium]